MTVLRSKDNEGLDSNLGNTLTEQGKHDTRLILEKSLPGPQLSHFIREPYGSRAGTLPASILAGLHSPDRPAVLTRGVFWENRRAVTY